MKSPRLEIDPRPTFDLSPYLYMQFMEPLGTTEGSVEAAWDFRSHRWRPDVVRITKELAPGLIRWPGGVVTRYYRWKEGVGPRERRRPMQNVIWGGQESNQVGTHEFIEFCRRVGADPLIAVNFEADGARGPLSDPAGTYRPAGPQEAAAWVDYCNNPANPLRRRHGVKSPYDVRLWQIGNEISYFKKGAYDCETTARRTVAFARAMRKRDPSIELIGWGHGGWAPRMIEIAGEHLQYLAFHTMFGVARERRKNHPLKDTDFRKDPARTWEYLLEMYKRQEEIIGEMRQQVEPHNMPLAITEGHFALSGRNRCDVQSTWACGVAVARVLNVHERNGDLLKIATFADFCGTRWQNNAVMIPTPYDRNVSAYMMPVAHVMRLYRRHGGRKALETLAVPAGLDVTASRTGRRVFLHVVNTQRTRSVSVRLAVAGMRIASGRVFTLAADPTFEVMRYCPEDLSPVEKALPRDRHWTFAPASVSAVELTVLTGKKRASASSG